MLTFIRTKSGENWDIEGDFEWLSCPMDVSYHQPFIRFTPRYLASLTVYLAVDQIESIIRQPKTF